MRDKIAGVVRQPLVHFVLIGAAIWGCYALFRVEAADGPGDTIRITAGEVAWLETTWQKKWLRPPTPAEREGLVAEYIRESVMYREALAMGLDRNDTVIRRRLAQKLQFLSDDLAGLSQPAEQDLRSYFTAHIDRYRLPDLLTFTQVFVDPDRRGERTLEDAATIKAELQALKDPAQDAGSHGDPFMLQRYYPERSEPQIAKLFGREFAAGLFELPLGRWHGPVLSGYGVHLVYVHARQEMPEPTFSAVQDRVKQDWQDNRRQEFNERYYARLLARYNVIVEEGTPGEAPAAPQAEPR